MNITRKKNKSGTALILDGDLTIYTVTQAHRHLLDEYQNLPDSIALDLQRVGEIDTAGVQLLLFLQKILRDNHQKMHLAKSNDHVDEVFSRLDVAAHFATGH